jgi:hypothetical protein
MRSQRYPGRRAILLAASLITIGAHIGGSHSPVSAATAVSARLDLIVRDIVYDADRDLIYAAVDGSDLTHPNTIVTVDPDTKTVVGAHPVGDAPYVLAITDDGSALYAGVGGAVTKFSLPGFGSGWTYTLGQAPGTPWAMIAGDIEVMPGTVDTIAVAAFVGPPSSGTASVVLVDAGVARPNTIVGYDQTSESIAFSDSGAELFGSNPSFGFIRHRVDAAGLTLTEISSPTTVWTIEHHAGFIYGSAGGVLDVRAATTLVEADLLPAGGYAQAGGAAIDPAVDVLYLIDQPNVGAMKVDAFQRSTLEPLGAWNVTDNVGAAKRLVALSDQRLAYIDSLQGSFGPGHLVILDISEELLKSHGEYTPLTPQRILDTREGLGRQGVVAPIGPGETIDVDVTGVAGVPSAGVDAVVMNMTAVAPTDPGFLTVYPTGGVQPEISSLNFTPGGTVANLVSVRVGAGGRVSIFNPYGAVDVLLDVAGFYSSVDGPDGNRYYGVEPRRQMDTRDPDFAPYGPTGAIGPDRTVTLDLMHTSVSVVPSSALAVALNVTVTEPTAPSYVSVYPSDVSPPTVSNLNFGPGQTLANQVIVRLPPSGVLNIYNRAGNAHVVVDVVGYYLDTEIDDDGRFISFAPFRAIDTRRDSPFPPPGDLWSGDILYWGSPDDDASAYVMNVTVTDTVESGYLTVYPFSPSWPNPPYASSLNYTAGRTVPNHVISRTGPYVGFYNFGGKVQLVVDVFGAFT